MIMNEQAVQALANFCESKLDLASADLGSEYHYQSLPLCVIDAIYSINANYTSTSNTVKRFCEHFNLKRIADERPPSRAEQLSISAFIKLSDAYGVVGMAEKVYQNRQRTSTRSGILKAEAVLMFSRVLQGFGVEYLQDTEKVLGDLAFEQQIKSLPGQASGLSLRYFYMLAGSDDYIKPDRMIRRFIEAALNRPVNAQESHDVLVGACKQLAAKYPQMTPRLLDHVIWRFQQAQ